MDNFCSKLQKLTCRLFGAVIFLLPLKFGAMLLPGVPQRYPDSVMGWLVTSLPPAFFCIVAGCLLIMSLAAFGAGAVSWKSASGRLLLLFLLLPLAALLGFINADGWEYAIIELEYLFGLSAFAGSTAIILGSTDLLWHKKFLNVFVASVLTTAVVGGYQYFCGFDDLKNFIEMQEKVYNIKIPDDLKARALDVRTYATFTFASAFAGFLLLSGALSVLRAYAWGRLFEPVKLSQRLFFLLALLLCGGIFLTTRGRSAFLAAIVAAAVCGLILIKKRKVQIILIAGALLAITAGAFYIHYAGRGFGSMTERVGYLQTSFKMLIEHPFCGGGWGDFSYAHAFNKSFGNQELAKDPHNIVAAFASQTGFVGGLLTAMILLYVLYLAYRRIKLCCGVEAVAVFGSICAFSLHMLMDLDWQVPGLMACYIFLAFCCARTIDDANKAVCCRNPRSAAAAMIFFCIAACLGAVHWSMAEQSFGNMLAAAGQEAGVYSQPQSFYEVDAAAEKALKIAPYSHSIYNAWAKDKMYRRDLVRAEELFLKALEYAPRSHAITKSLSELYSLRGDVKKAQEYEIKSDKLFPYRKIFFSKERGLKNE